MSTPAGPTPLVVARLSGGPGADVLEVVRDWTATGLLAPSLWVDADQRTDVPALTVVDADGAVASPAEEWLARQGAIGLRIVVLQVFPADGSGEPAAEAARALLDRIGLGGRPLVDLLVPAGPTTGIPADAALPARPNVLLQARDARGPGAFGRPVPAAELAAHAAAGLATVAGLWAGMVEAPFDRDPVWPGRQVVVARAYARVLDSQEVLRELSWEVHRAEGTLPRPRTPLGDRLPAVPEAQARPTAEAAALSLVDAHARLTRFAAPPPFQPRPVRAIRLLTAVGMFLSYLWAAVRNAPRAWVTALVHRAALGIAQSATAALFGPEAAYEVVVLGVRPSGEQQADPDDDDVTALLEQVQQLVSRLSPGTEFTALDTSAFWGDMTTVGVSLADGSEVPPQVQVPLLGVDRQVLDRPELIAPRPDGPAHRLPVGVLPDVGGLAVEPDDPYLALQAHRLLTEQLQAAPGGAGYQLLDTARTALWSWAERQRSYTWKVGLELAQELDRARQTLAEAVRAVTDPGGAPPRDVLDTQRRTRRAVLIALAVAVLALALVIGLVAGGVLGVRIGVILAVLVASVWLSVSVRVFLRHQRALFTWLHQRDESRRHREWAQACTVHVAGEVHRLGVLYRQSRLWARVLAAVVHDPFGGAGAAGEAPGYPTGLSGSLPLSTAVGTASFSPAEHGQLVHDARRAQLGTGWLGRQLQVRVEAALAARSQRYGRAEHRAAWSDSGYSPDGPLAELVAVLGSPADRQRAAADADARLVGWLTGLGARRGVAWSLAAVHPRVTVTAGAVPGTVTGAEFLSPLLASVDDLEPQGFSATGAAVLADRVDRTSLAVVGVPAPGGAAGLLRTTAGTGPRSLDRFVARLDRTRLLDLDHVAHFRVAEPEAVPDGWYPADAIDVRM